MLEIEDRAVPKKVIRALQAERDARAGLAYALMWDDIFFSHGEDGWCLRESSLAVCKQWLQEQTEANGMDDTEAFWFHITMS